MKLWATIGVIVTILFSVLWVRSAHHADVFLFFTNRGRVQALASVPGSVLLVASNIEMGERRAWRADFTSDDPEAMNNSLGWWHEYPPVRHEFLGFHLIRRPKDALGIPSAWYVAVGVPHWLIVAPLSLLQMRWGIQLWICWRRRKRGLCIKCGYDLRETPDRCPECGISKHGALQ